MAGARQRRQYDRGGALGDAGDLATRDELVERYAAQSDRDLSALDWYVVLACFKLGIILEGTFARAAREWPTPRSGDRLHATTLSLFRRALDLTSTSGDGNQNSV